MFSFVSGSVSCNEILSVHILKNTGCCSVCLLPKMLPQVWKLNQQTPTVFAFFIRICSHCAAQLHHQDHRPWARDKVCVEHSVCFHALFNLGGKHESDAHWLFILIFELCFCAWCFSHVAFWYLFIFAQNSSESQVSSEILRILDNYNNCPGVLPGCFLC